MRYLANLIMVILTSVTILNAQTYVLDGTQSSLTWTGKAAFSTYELSGTIDALRGEIIISPDGDMKDGYVLIDMLSLDADIDDLKKHLRGRDFFDVDNYQQAKFELIEMIHGIDCCDGMMTIKDITNPFSPELHLTRQEGQVRITGTIMINRTDYGITFNSPSYFEKLKDQAIADEFKIVLSLLFRSEL